MSHDYLTVWLPGILIVGLGIGLAFPVLSAAAVSSLQPERFAVGSAVNQTARQVGGAFGVALLVVILGNPHSLADALNHFHDLCGGTPPRQRHCPDWHAPSSSRHGEPSPSDPT